MPRLKMKSMATCKKCGAEFVRGSLYPQHCPNCGAPVEPLEMKKTRARIRRKPRRKMSPAEKNFLVFYIFCWAVVIALSILRLGGLI